MGVVTVSSSAARTSLGLGTKYLTRVSLSRRPVIISFQKDKTKNAALVVPRESVALPLETNKENEKRLRKVKKRPERVNVLLTDQPSPSTSDLDYNEAAAKLEYIFKQSPTTVIPIDEVKDQGIKKRLPRRRRTGDIEEKEKQTVNNVVRTQRRERRLTLEKRIALRTKKADGFLASSQKIKHKNRDEDVKTDRLVRDYSASTDLVSLDWKKMKIPPVLPSSEHSWLFKMMQPMKVRFGGALSPISEPPLQNGRLVLSQHEQQHDQREHSPRRASFAGTREVILPPAAVVGREAEEQSAGVLPRGEPLDGEEDEERRRPEHPSHALLGRLHHVLVGDVPLEAEEDEDDEED